MIYGTLYYTVFPVPLKSAINPVDNLFPTRIHHYTFVTSQ